MQWSQCPYCGSQIAPHLSQCPACGNSLIGEDLPVYGEAPRSEPAPDPRPVEPVRVPVEPRPIYTPHSYSFFAFLILGFLTFGIYWGVVAEGIARDLDTICTGDGRRTPGGVEFYLLSLFTCGLYGILWEYGVAERVKLNGPRFGYQNAPGGIAVLLWNTAGLLFCGLGPFIAWAQVIDEVNTLNATFSRWLMTQL